MELMAETYYVDATNGNDSNDGLSPESARQTIAKVNSMSFLPGDNILLKCGGEKALTFLRVVPMDTI